MKKILFIQAILFLSFSLLAQTATKIDFVQDKWEVILAKARSENKMVFVDAYTTWCGPCKLMDKKTFNNDLVATYFNETFINAKIDMEKGEGPTLARTFDVTAYPTLLFVNAQGKAVHRGLGFHDENQLIELANVAQEGSQTNDAMAQKFAEGNRDPVFLLEYIDTQYGMQNGSHLPIAEAYLESAVNLSMDEKMEFVYMYTSDTDTKLFDFIIKNKSAFIQKFGQESVDSKISDLIYLESNLDMKPEELAKLDALFKKANPKTAKRESANFRMAYFRQKGDRQNFGLAAKTFMKKNKRAKAPELNDLAWTFYQVIDDPKLLKSAIKWAKKSVALSPKGYSFETLASLYNKSGKTEKAIATINKGIAISKGVNEDTSSLETLLATIQSENPGE